jgi:hypothetical protein
MNDSLKHLDKQLNKLESGLNNTNDEKNIKEKIANEKISSIPSMMRCYVCEGKKDYQMY